MSDDTAEEMAALRRIGTELTEVLKRIADKRAGASQPSVEAQAQSLPAALMEILVAGAQPGHGMRAGEIPFWRLLNEQERSELVATVIGRIVIALEEEIEGIRLDTPRTAAELAVVKSLGGPEYVRAIRDWQKSRKKGRELPTPPMPV